MIIRPQHLLLAALALGGCAAAPPPDDLTGRDWVLVELNGRPLPELERPPYLALSVEPRRASGFAGCNRFMGGYVLDAEASRIRFEALAGTMMACARGMDVEAEFHKALAAADNYSLSGDTLTLNRARMAPLARFRAAR